MFLNKFDELKKEISDVRKLLEISGVGDYTTDEAFIKVSIVCEIFLKNIFTYLIFFVIGIYRRSCFLLH